jgi:hypothetical protein
VTGVSHLFGAKREETGAQSEKNPSFFGNFSVFFYFGRNLTGEFDTVFWRIRIITPEFAHSFDRNESSFRPNFLTVTSSVSPPPAFLSPRHG